ncbi:MAG: hypothetical protein GPJ54_09040 [Candidatus Heimdallarchaeota archaeon]|nr:hypothetical protein [Candidatus Heimdallarchaeota archaeon]
MGTKIDYKKDFPVLYRPKEDPQIIEVPDMHFFMIDGKGDPNTAVVYKLALEALYAVSYALKMKIVKKENPGKDYVVPPLEGLWYMDDMKLWSSDKSKWKWTMMIRIPDFVTDDQVKRSIQITKDGKNPKSLDQIYLKNYIEGKVVQLMHIGSYDSEGDNIEKMHKYARDKGYELHGKHHEIYLGDPRKAAPEKLKTVLRQPIIH